VRSSVVGLGMLIRADMCDGTGMLHQGCMAFLMDEYETPLCHCKNMSKFNMNSRLRGSAIALLVMNMHEGGENRIGVSQTMNILYHAAAPL
jgi:acyl-coenzyme A thioesterase 13